MLNDPLANTLSKMVNAEKIGRESCLVRPASKVILKVLDIMNEKGYIGKYEIVSEGRGKVLKIYLIGKLNKAGVIKPRFSVKYDGGYEKFEKRYLPAKGFGHLIVSTPKGMMIHEEAKDKKFGGVLIAYFY